MNKAILIGRLCDNPDHRVTANGISVCTFTLAVNRKFKAQDGVDADFIHIVCWRGLADNCNKFLSKGSKAAVVGAIQTRTYEASDGSKRYVTEIVADEVEFLDTINKLEPKREEEVVDIEGFTTVEDENPLPF